MLADACATCAGAVCGTSTVTTFVESSAGVAEGGRTGLASMATAVMFFIAMFLAPVAQLIPTYATAAAALIYVGVLMIVQRPATSTGTIPPPPITALCHRGLHAPDLQHFLRYCLRPDLLRFR